MINVEALKANLPAIAHRGVGSGYYIEGLATFPRVTSIVAYLSSPTGLTKWRNKLVNEKLKEAFEADKTYTGTQALQAAKNATEYPEAYALQAAEFGTICHKWLEDYLTTGSLPPTPEYTGTYADMAKSIQSIKTFIFKWNLSQPNITPIKCEAFLYSKKFQYAGNTDFIVVKGNDLFIMDWKFANSSLSYTCVKYGAQVAAYAKAVEELTGVKVNKCFIVRFKKDGSMPEVFKMDETAIEQNWVNFKCALMAYRADNKLPFINFFGPEFQ